MSSLWSFFGWGPEVCISNKFSEDVDLGVKGPQFDRIMCHKESLKSFYSCKFSTYRPLFHQLFL